MNGLCLRSADGRFGLALETAPLRRILARCRRAGRAETGGILIGHYAPALDRAIVTAATSAPPDSRAGPTWFRRGVYGLQRLLDTTWRDRRGYYLGEWHFHPAAAPAPSPTDDEQMRAIAAAEAYHCPEPVLLIVGGEVRAGWRVRAFVFVRGGRRVDLLPGGRTGDVDATVDR